MAEYRVDGLSRGSGFIIQGLGGVAVPRYSLVYLSGSNTWSLADADAAATMPVVGLAVEPLSVGQLGRILLRGVVNNNGWAWTPGGEIYASAVAGGLTQTAPALAQQVAVAVTATEILFDPHVVDPAFLDNCRIATGTYTGDGTVSQAIDGVGFRPRFLVILEDPGVETAAQTPFWTIDSMTAGLAMEVDTGTVFDNRVDSLDADGFTVDDDGANADPNQSGVLYAYAALG